MAYAYGWYRGNEAFDGILEMEDVIKAYDERQGIGGLYEQRVPMK